MSLRLKKDIALNEKGFLVDPNKGDSFLLNNVGLDIVLLLQKGKVKSFIINFLCAKYNADLNTISGDYQFFINELLELQLLNND